jgi:hypothetical protein
MKLRPLPVLFLLVVTSLFLIAPRPAAAQASAVLKWAQMDKPGSLGNIVVNPSEVTDIAIGRGNLLYAVDGRDAPNGKVYRSENTGLTWLDITSALLHAGASLPFTRIACAPDQPKNVAVITNDGTKVYLSSDFGADWKDTNLPAITGTIQCVSISETYILSGTNLWDVAIGTAIWNNNTTEGQVWVLTTGGLLSTWQNQGLAIAPATAADVSAVAFSPNYRDDGTILVVGSTGIVDGGHTYLCAGQRDLAAHNTLWNAASPYFINYPVDITVSGDQVGVNVIISSIALPSDYRGDNAESRKVLVSCDRQEPSLPSTLPIIDSSDVYRIDDTASTRVLALDVGGGTAIDIRNIAYYGTLATGKVIAGDVNQVDSLLITQVRRLSDPFSITVSTSWTLAEQPPTGPGNAVVLWSTDGSAAYCGTGILPGAANDESAFSVSNDNGNTWEQTSLINTTVNISDIAPAPDSKSFFLASFSAGPATPESVWRTAGTPLGVFWSRILTLYTSSDRLIIRLSPDYAEDYTIYVAETNSKNKSSIMAVSHIRGNTNTWQKLTGPAPIIDMEVKDRDTVFIALSGGNMRESTTDGESWLIPPVNCFPYSESELNMFSIAGKGDILAGSRDSRVSYSTDNGTSFTEIDKPVGYSAGDVQIIADADYKENKLIYAADNVSDDGIWRWTIGSSTEWEQIDEPITDLGTDQRICGLGMGTEGTLYALRSDNVTVFDDGRGGGMDRSLNPAQSSVYQIEWDIVNRTLPTQPDVPSAKPTSFDPRIIFPNTMPSLKLSGDASQNTIWAVDFSDMLIYRFDDTICKGGPAVDGSEQVGCDPVSGRSQEVNLDWEQLSLSDRYEAEIAKDALFSLQVLGNDQIIPVDLTSPAVFFPAGGAVTAPASEIADPGNLECGHTYYWRTRTREATTGEIIRSRWSETGSFTVKAGLPVTTAYYGPELLSPGNGCVGCPVAPVSFSWAPYKETTRYRFALAEDAAMTKLLIDDEAHTSGYEYNGELDYGSDYYWRVMAVDPSPSDWSAVFVFQTQKAVVSSTPAAVPGTPQWVWVLIAAGSVLVLVTVSLIFVVR